MIFKLKNSDDMENLTVTKIIDHSPLKDFLQNSSKPKKVILCPTNAIDIDNKEMSEKCIDCGVCWVNNTQKIEKMANTPDYNSFKSYMLKEKMFVYKWLSLILSDYSGINIKSTGFSRTKRIPLIAKEERTLYIFKSIRNIADFDDANYELDDMAGLIKEQIKDYDLIKVIIVINGNTETKSLSNVKVIGLFDIHNKMLQKGEISIKDII